MARIKKYRIGVLAALILSSTLLLGVTCQGVGEKLVNNVNPCGTILNCNPAEYDLVTTDFPDYDKDPTCTIPGQCGTVWPSLIGGSGF